MDSSTSDRDKISQPVVALAALQFLDRNRGEWFCASCWAEAALIDDDALNGLAVALSDQKARSAGYQSATHGQCTVCDNHGSRPGGSRARWSVRSLGPQRRDSLDTT